MENTGYIYKQDNTQKVFLSEKTIDVEDILKKYYDYIYQAICEEGIILKAPECNLFKELVFENKVVGFCSYDFSREFITAALNNIYVLPKFRGNNLFLEELEKTMLEHNKPSIVEPTRLVVELLIKYGFAKKVSENIVASSLEFIVPGNHVIANGDYDQTQELSTHFYDLNTCASIHFLDINENSIAYSEPLNYDIIHYDCIEARNSLDDDYISEIRELFISKDVEIMETLLNLEESIPVKSYTLEEVVGGENEFSPYIESLIDDAHVTYERALKIKQQMIEEYEAGMILNESLLIRLAYLFDDNSAPKTTSHSDVCPYCGMPVDDHDRFCHFCGINLQYNPDEVFDSLIESIDEGSADFTEDIRFIAYKFLKLIDDGIELEYSIFNIENTYDIQRSVLLSYLDKNNLFKKENITSKGFEFMDSHPLNYYEKYCLSMVDYTDFERYFYENQNLSGKKIVINYLRQFGDEYLDIIKEIEGN